MEGHRHGHVGFRFHPTEEEIITYFLERKMCGLDFPVRTIEDVVDVCKYEPWELPQRSSMPKEDRVWYFFNEPVSKYANSKRVNRTTKSGFWKVTGKDREIWDTQGKQRIGFKKNLVFHEGRVPNGIRTNWVIHEYHSHKAALSQKEYVLFRLKRKSGVKPDNFTEPSRPLALASDYGNRATENTNTQMNHGQFLLDNIMLDHNPLSGGQLFSGQGTSNSNGFDLSSLLSMVQQEQGTSNSNGFDLSSLLSMVQQEQGTSNSNGFDLSSSLSMVQQEQETLYSDGFNNERSMLNDSVFETIEQEDAFVNSLLADQGESSGEISANTLLHDFNPPKPFSVVYFGDSSDTDTEMVFKQNQMLETSGLVYNRRGRAEMALPWAPNASSSSSDGDAIMELDISSVTSDTALSGIFCPERVVDEFPINARIRKAQHTPKSHNGIEAQCSTRELQMQSKVSQKAVSSKVEVREAVKHAVDLPRTENSTVKFGKDKQMVRTTSARTSSNSSSSSSSSPTPNRSGSSNRKSSFISLETPQLSHKINPPSVYLFNVLVSLVLIIFIIREMVYLH